MKKIERFPSTFGAAAKSRIFRICLLALLGLGPGGCATLSMNPAGDPGTYREFPDFVAVVVREGDNFSSLAAKYLKDSSWGWFIADYNEMDSPIPGQTLIIPLKPEKRGGLTIRGYQTVPVISYHNFSETEANKLTMNREMFEQQMRFLKEGGYRVISLDRLFDFLEFKASIPPKSVVITIDDGWLSAYEIAYPILKKFGYPATFFIYTDIIGKSPKSLSWSLLQEMSGGGMDIQCHTKSHRILTLATEKESFRDYFGNMEGQLSICKEVIEQRLNTEVKYLAYPYGVTNSLVVEAAKKSGYRGALTIKRGGNPFFVHNFRVNRSEIHGNFTLRQFEKNLDVFQEQPLR